MTTKLKRAVRRHRANHFPPPFDSPPPLPEEPPSVYWSGPWPKNYPWEAPKPHYYVDDEGRVALAPKPDGEWRDCPHLRIWHRERALPVFISKRLPEAGPDESPESRVSKFVKLCQHAERLGISPREWGWECMRAYYYLYVLDPGSGVLDNLARIEKRRWNAAQSHTREAMAHVDGLRDDLHPYEISELEDKLLVRHRTRYGSLEPPAGKSRQLGPRLLRYRGVDPRKPMSPRLDRTLANLVLWLVHAPREQMGVVDACHHVADALAAIGADVTWSKVRRRARRSCGHHLGGTLTVPGLDSIRVAISDAFAVEFEFPPADSESTGLRYLSPLTISAAAEACGVSKPVLALILQGKRVPSTKEQSRIEAAIRKANPQPAPRLFYSPTPHAMI